MSSGIIFVIIAGVSIWLIVFLLCRAAAKSALQAKGFTVISIRWVPFEFGSLFFKR